MEEMNDPLVEKLKSDNRRLSFEIMNARSACDGFRLRALAAETELSKLKTKEAARSQSGASLSAENKHLRSELDRLKAEKDPAKIDSCIVKPKFFRRGHSNYREDRR